MKNKRYHNILLVATILVCILIIYISPMFKKGMNLPDYYHQNFEDAVVVQILSEELSSDPVVDGLVNGRQEAVLKINSGKYAGEIYKSVNILDQAHNVLLREGLEVIVGVRETDSGPNVWVYNHKRTPYLYVLGGLFLVALLYFGGKKGLDAIVALGFTATVFIFILLPLIFRGYDAVWLSILCAVISLVVSFLLIGGFEKKTFVAIVGTFIGIVVAGAISSIFSHLTNISGVHLEKGTQLVYVALDYDIKVKGLMFTSILIASLGAVMDVAMSISSSMYEMHTINPNMSTRDLFDRGMNIGKDIMGTMANTLILAFMGGSFSLMLLLWGYNMDYRQMMNLPFISVELIQGLAGSIGIVLTVPFTALIACIVYKRTAKS